MTATFQAERFRSAVHDIKLLVDAHWEEVGSYKDRFRRSIDYDAYQNWEDQGRLLTVTGREDGRLLGYFVGVTGVDLHRVTLTDPPQRVGVVSWLVYYVVPEKRGYAAVLAKAAEREAGKRGVSIVNTRVKPGMNGADAFFARLGYSETEVTMTRIIGNAANVGSSKPTDA